MKKLIVLMAFSILAMAGTSAYASHNYRIDDSAVEAVFENSVAVMTLENAPEMFKAGADMGITAVSASDPNGLVAFLLAFFLGGFGIHRVYLGGGGKQILLYIITCFGIFGIVPLIDWILLLVGVINDDISQYVNNTKFIMW